MQLAELVDAKIIHDTSVLVLNQQRAMVPMPARAQLDFARIPGNASSIASFFPSL